MQPYNNHLEHLEDILKLYSLHGQESAGSLFDAIISREAITENTFLPACHICNSFGISEKKELYIAAALSVLGLTVSSSVLPPLERAVFRHDLQAIMDEKADGLKPRILDFLLAPFTPLARPWLKYGGRADEALVAETAAQALRRIIDGFLNEAGTGLVWVHGKQGCGKKTHIAYALDKLPFVLADIGQITGHGDFFPRLDELLFECRLMGLVPVFYGIPEKGEHDWILGAILNRLQEGIKLAFITSQNPPPQQFEKIKGATIQIPAPDRNYSLRLWTSLSDSYNFTAALDTEALAGEFVFTPGEIKQNLEKARIDAMAKGDKLIDPAALRQICKQSRLKKLPLLGRPANIPIKWDDLILPDAAKNTLESVVQRVANHDLVFAKWGFEKVLPYGRGITVLLEGYPGTGKTMAAHALAERIGLPMYKVDLSAVVSKYIGETEKNLQALFDEAEQADCILFFDEAEALFGKRMDVKDSKDRYANLEVSFLLQRLEEHQGLTILASNLTRNFDEAFKRRFTYAINIPMPDRAERERIWRAAIPAGAPIGDIDFEYLAAKYEISGAEIKKRVLEKAFEGVTSEKELILKDIAHYWEF